jgi:ribonuclease HII
MTEKGYLEQQIWQNSKTLVGLDEVGRGCIAGPVYAAAVSLDYAKLFALPERDRKLIRDSKTLSHRQRQSILPVLEEIAVTWSLGHSTPRQIEQLGIVPATFAAMHQALAALEQDFDLLLIDGREPLPNYQGHQKALIKGDSQAYAIAAASIFAKEARDAIMREADEEFPEYGFANHVGYGTKQHREALVAHGICHLHRRNFAPIHQYATDT